MRHHVCVLVMLSGLAIGCGDNVDDDPNRVVLDDGVVKGSVQGGTRQFLGIPYARPPVGDLRWRAPVKNDPYDGVLDATRFGKRCAQLASATLMNQASEDEDCLYLNVWTPIDPPAAPLPVMFWIHGGGNINGSASEPVPFVNTGVFYSGEFLAANHDVVVVSINYRLGVFGFYAHPDLRAEGSSGNQGLWDQQLALTWVRDNIKELGGDPANVTIFGESAGSFDVCMHMVSPQSRGLFHRAISQSGGCTTKQTPAALAETGGSVLAAAVGCTGADQLACMRGKPVAELMASEEVAAGVGFGPTVDGVFVPDEPRALFDSGAIARVPYLLGSNTDEGTLFVGGATISDETEYSAALQEQFGAFSAQVIERYPVADFADGLPNPALAAFARVIGDARLVCTTFDTATRMVATGGPVYLYNYDIPVPLVLPGRFLGATHGAELPSVFGTSPAFTTETRAAAELMQRYWTSFARTGDPNGGGGDLAWPPLTAADNRRVNLAVASTIVTDFRAAECALWSAAYAAEFDPR